MNRFFKLSLILAFVGFGRVHAVEAPAESTEELAAYGSLGHSIAQSLHFRDLKWSDAQLDAFVRGMKAGRRGEDYTVSAKTESIARDLNRAIAEAQAREHAAPNHPADDLRDMVSQFGMMRTPTGFHIRVLNNGIGPRPRMQDTVVLTFSGRLLGAAADMSGLSRQHLRIKVSALIPGMQEAVQMLALNSQAVLILPPELSFGEGQWPKGVQRGSTLVFLIELEDIVASDAVR